MATQNLCSELCTEVWKQLRCSGHMGTWQRFLLCSAPGHTSCCCLAAWEAAKGIRNREFCPKRHPLPRSLMKGVESCKTERRGTGPLTPPKPLGRAVCEPVPLFWSQKHGPSKCGNKGSCWIFGLKIPANSSCFSKVSVALCCLDASVLRAGKELVRLGKNSSLQRQNKHSWMLPVLPACELFDMSVKGAGHSQCQMEENQHLAVTVIIAPVTPVREGSSPFAILPLGTCFQSCISQPLLCSQPSVDLLRLQLPGWNFPQSVVTQTTPYGPQTSFFSCSSKTSTTCLPSTLHSLNPQPS